MVSGADSRDPKLRRNFAPAWTRDFRFKAGIAIPAGLSWCPGASPRHNCAVRSGPDYQNQAPRFSTEPWPRKGTAKVTLRGA